MNIIVIIILSTGIIFAQTDWEKWDKTDINYEIQVRKDQSSSDDNSSVGSVILRGLQDSYSFLISDVDGDNCPFYPSCSNFYIESIQETNIFQGTLMFADRFTRDSNLYKGKTHYPHHSSGKYFDPTYNYYLKQNEVHFYSRVKIVE